jgi:RNase P/RNase MRP subunit POP5
MLKRRYKRRYIGIICEPSLRKPDHRALYQLILERNSELFGYVFNQVSYIKLAKNNHTCLTIISCRTESLDQVLVTLAFLHPSLIVVDVSGSIKKLKLRGVAQAASLPSQENPVEL